MSQSITTLNHDLSDAEVCRRNGWGPGTRLSGAQGKDTATMTITAVGESLILAKTPKFGESTWSLAFRDWKEIK